MGYDLCLANRAWLHRQAVPGEWVLPELCTLCWIAAIVLGASLTSNILLWIWVLGMLSCIPLTGWISAQKDADTTMFREIVYLLWHGVGTIGMRVVFWPVTLCITYFGESHRNAYFSQLWSEFREKSPYIRHDTATQMACARVQKVDNTGDSIVETTDQVFSTVSQAPTVACRTAVVATTLVGVAGAQDPATTQPVSTSTTWIFLARTGQNLQSPFTGTYRMTEFLRIHGKTIIPDVGCVDFANGRYRECYVGGGRTLFAGKRITLTGEVFFVQATGPAAHSARYIWPNAIVDAKLSRKVSFQASYFPYIPLNTSATKQQVLERAKFERKLGDHWKIGVGYAGYQYGNGPWQSRPFATVTYSSKLGSLELWPFQKITAGAQAQIRYSFSHTTTHNRR